MYNKHIDIWWLDGWMDKRMIGCVTDLGTEMHGRVDGWINEWWMDIQINGGVNLRWKWVDKEWMDEWVDQMDGRMDMGGGLMDEIMNG